MSQPLRKRARATVGAAAYLVAAALALLLADGAPSAHAHAGYQSSTPADGEVLAESPPRVDMYTSQEMARSEGRPILDVVNDSGDTLSTNTTLDDEDRTHVFAELPAEMAEGRYTVIWRTLSDEDGEEAQGAFHFYVGDAPDTTPPSTSAPGATTPAAASPTPAPTESGDDDGVPPWMLVVGTLAGAVVGGGAGVAFGRRVT